MITKFINNYLHNRGYIKADKLPQWLMQTSEAEQWTMPDPSVYGNQADLYRKLSYIGTAVDIVADACIDADFDILNEQEEEDDNHPLMKLLDNPNPYDSRTDFLRAHFAWRKISGNSYWFLNRSSENVAPDEVWLLPPNKIIPVPDGAMGLKGYMYYPGNGAEIPLEPYEVLHFKSFNPNSRYIGLSAIESLAFTSTGAIASQEWNTRLFAENNARLPGILAFAEMIQDGDWEKMKKEVANSAAKRNNMMLRGVGKGGVEWMQGSATQREMEFLAGLQMSKQDIYDRIAPGLFSAMQTSALTNGENGLFLFAKYTIQPLLRETTDKLNSDLLPVYGEGWQAEYEDVVSEDRTLVMAEIDQFAKFHTIDEVRVEKFGNAPDPDPERGKLLAVQLTAKLQRQAEQTVEKPAEKPEAPKVEEETDEEMKADLHRWKRKAIRTVGTPEAAKFAPPHHIPDSVVSEISAKVKACKSVDEVEAVFNSAYKAEVKQDDSAIRELARVIELAVAKAENV